MREIKFRIYFEDEEPFMSEPITLEDLLHEDWIEFQNEDNTLSLPLKDFRFFYERNKNYKIMQYTGLKDKNGVEIYEGDIVKIKCYDKNFIGKVVFNTAHLEYQLIDKDNFYSEIWDKLEPEVIGNIYDNPELLED